MEKMEKKKKKKEKKKQNSSLFHLSFYGSTVLYYRARGLQSTDTGPFFYFILVDGDTCTATIAPSSSRYVEYCGANHSTCGRYSLPTKYMYCCSRVRCSTWLLY